MIQWPPHPPKPDFLYINWLNRTNAKKMDYLNCCWWDALDDKGCFKECTIPQIMDPTCGYVRDRNNTRTSSTYPQCVAFNAWWNIKKGTSNDIIPDSFYECMDYLDKNEKLNQNNTWLNS